MPIELKKSSVLAGGIIRAEISTPVRPTFKTTQVTRGVESGARHVTGFAHFDDGSQDVLTIAYPKDLTDGKDRVSKHTFLLRYGSDGLHQYYFLDGEIEVRPVGYGPWSNGGFNLHGDGITVVGVFFLYYYV